jgi:hypothetical protein
VEGGVAGWRTKAVLPWEMSPVGAGRLMIVEEKPAIRCFFYMFGFSSTLIAGGFDKSLRLGSV